MKSIILTIIKVLFIVILATWMIIFVADYFRAREGNHPLICLKEQEKTNVKGTYYTCTSFGYKYFEIKEASGQTTYGFSAAFIKSDVEKEWEE